MARLTKEYLSLIEGSGVSGNIQGAKKSVSSSIEGSTNVPQENQTAVVYDIISEGPIEGLVDGTNSIFLDKTPVTIGDTKHQPIKIKNATFTASNSTLVDSDSSNPFANLSVADGKRFIRIPKGKKSITGNGSSTGVSGSEGSTILTASSSFFEAEDVSDINPLTGTDTPIDTDTPKPFIRIEGAGTNSNVAMVAPIIRFISATSVEIGHPLPRDISYKTASIDKIGTISSFTDTNTAVIADLGAVGTAKIDASNVEVEVFTPSIGREDTVYNYQGFQYAFMHGQRNQPYLKGFKDIGSAAIIENKNQAVEQTRDLFSSNDNTTTGAWNTTVADATAQPVIVTDSAVANPEEVDNVKLTFKFPQMIASKSNSGDEKPANCELRIWLGFKKTGDSAFTEKLMFGATQSELDSRSASKKTRPWESPHNSGKIRTLTKAPFAESFVIDLTPFKPFSEYQIKIQRVDPSQGRHRDYDHISPCTLDTVEHRFTDKLAYPNSAFATMLFDAESFSKIPSRSYEVKGLKVKVPTNYFPKGEEGRAYGEYDRNPSSGADSGSYQNWDGNFRGDISTFTKGHINHELVWTDNPAWVFYDLVTNKRYGVGKYIDEAQIDKFELYKIARYCDELVADGKGGTEPRFTANVYIKESADALKVLKDITQIFRGMLYWLDGQIQFSQNRYQLPVYTFSKGNVTGGFSYTSPRGEFRSNQVRVTWNDPESMYKQAVEIVEDTNNILETGKVVPKDIVAFGATSRGQAHRFGKWALFTEILESEAVAFQSSINAGFLKPGDVILIQDADKDVISNSGRLSTSSSTTSINLDRNVNLSSGNTFKLSIMYPQGGAYLSSISATINDNTGDAAVTNNYQRGDLVTHAKVNGTVVEITTDTQARNAVDSSGNGLDLEWNSNSRVETQTISTTGSSVSTLTTGAFTSAPNAEMMWAIREYDAAGDIVNGSAQQYVISEIKEDANKLYTISALKYDPSKFDLVDRGYILDVGVDTNKLPSFTETPPAPETLTLDVLKSFGSGLNDESNISGTTNKIRINWGRVLNSDGTQYKHLSHFEIKHNIDSLKGNKFKKLTVPKDENYLSVDFDGPKTMIVQIQSVNINGGKSQIVQRKLEVTNDQIVNSGTQILKIPNDGKINKHIQCSTSTVSIDSKNYQLQSSDGTIYTNPSNANAASYQQSFSGMANNSEAYLLFDASESATSGDILKAIEIKKDSTAQIPTGASTSIPLDFEYMAEVGASSSGITQLTANSQTISGSVGDNIITGSSTAFTTDFVNGDIIVIAPAGATRFYSKISYIENDGKLQIVDGLPRDYSSVAVSKLSFKPDPVSDVILAKVSYDGSTYTLEEKYTEGTESLGYFHHENTSNTNALSVDAFKTQFGRFPQEGDILIVVNTAASPKASKSYKFSNNAFSEIANFMTGDLLVDGTIEGDKIRSDTQIIAGADDSNKQAVLDGTGTGDNALRIYAGANVANKANAPFKVTQAGALTATSATIGGAIDATTLNVVNASVVGSLTASELTAGSVTVQSLNQAVWNEIDTRVAGASANGFYDNKDSTTGYLGVSKTLSLTGSSSAGYQHNGEDLHLRFQLVDSFGPTPAGFTGDGLKVTAQFQYRLASSSTWINVGSSLTESLTRTDYSSGALYDIDMDHDVEISSSLTTSSYYHFQVVLTPTITNNAFVAFITYNSGGANDSSGSPFHFAAQQGSTSVGSGSGTVTSVGSGDGLTGGAITGSGTLAVDSTVVRTSGTQTIAGDKTFSNDIIVSGNLDVRGTTTTLDTATLNVEDNNITLNYSTGDSTATANGAGITIQDAVNSTTDATILWDTTNDEFDFSHGITLPDSKRIKLGDDSDLQIYHNATDSVIDNLTGDLYITNKADDKDIIFRTDDGSGGFTTYMHFDGSASLTKFDVDTKHVDSIKATFGDSADLEIYHDGSNSFIRDTGTGNLRITSNGNAVEIRSSTIALQDNSAYNYLRTEDLGNGGIVKLYHGSVSSGTSEVFRTTSTGVDITGTALADKIQLGTETTSYIENTVGQSTDVFRFQTKNGRIDIGSQNSGYAHFYTDRSIFYFSTTIMAGSNIVTSYNDDLLLRRANNSNHQLTIGSSAITSSLPLIVNGDTTLNPTSNFVTIKGATNDNDYSGIIIQSNWANTSNGKNAGQIQFQADDDDITGSTHTTFATINAETTDWTGDSNIGGYITIQTSEANSLKDRLRVGNNGDISFYEDTGTTAKLFWDASGESLGIGTTSIAVGTKLQIAGETRIYPSSGTGVLRFGSGGVEKGKLSVDSSSNMILETAGAERARIDSSGINVTGTVVSDGATIAGTLELDSNNLDHTALSPQYNMIESDITGNNTQFLQVGGDLRIRTIDDSKANPVERLRIDHATGDISFYEDTGSTQALFWDASAESLGIGTTSPSHKLHIDSNGSSNSVIRIDADDNRGANRYALDIVDSDANSRGSVRISTTSGPSLITTGSVGIGTSSPSTILEIASGNSGGDAALDSPTFRINNTTESADWDVGDVVGTIEYYSSDVSGNAPYVTSFIKSVNETGNGTLPDGALTFGTSTYNALGGASERMRISSDGNVGIGTTSPQNPLEINTANKLGTTFTGGTDGEGIRITQTDYASGNNISLIESSHDNSSSTPDARIGVLYTSSGSTLKFGTSNNYSFGITNTAMVIDPLGNVGIGTSSPSQPLEVDGNIQATGTRSISALYDSNHYMRIEGNSSGGVLKGTDGGVITTLVRTYGDSYFNGGNFGIGTDSPQAKLQINDGDLYFDNDSYSDSNRIGFGNPARDGDAAYIDYIGVGNFTGHLAFGLVTSATNTAATEVARFDNNGRLGIGEDAPSGKLHIHQTGNGSTNTLILEDDARRLYLGRDQIKATDLGNNVQNLYIQSDGNTRFATNSGSVSVGSTTALASSKLYIRNGSSGQSYSNVSGVLIDVNGTSNSYYGLRVGSSTGDDHLAVTNAGNVGIGTSSPINKLTVDGDIRIRDSIASLFLQDTDGTNQVSEIKQSAGITTISSRNNTSNGATLFTGYNGTATTEYARFDSSGNFGIGTNSPTAPLSIGSTGSLGAISNNYQIATSIDGGYSTTNARQHKVIGFIGTTAGGVDIYDSSYASGEISKNFYSGLFAENSYFNASSYRIVQGGKSRLTIKQDGEFVINEDSLDRDFRVESDNNTHALFVQGSDGNVGINESTPPYKLSVNSGTSDWPGYFKSTDNKAGIIIADDDTTAYFGAENSKAFMGLQAGIHANNLNIDSSGNVGIGTVSPARKLEVDFTGSTIGARFTRSDTTGSSTIEFANSAGVKSVIGFNAGTNEFDINHNSAVRFAVDNNGAVTFNEAYTFPTADGSANQVLQTDGSGNLSFADTGAITAITNFADNRVLTASGSTTINGESNLTYDGSELYVGGTTGVRALKLRATMTGTNEVVTHNTGLDVKINNPGSYTLRNRFYNSNSSSSLAETVHFGATGGANFLSYAFWTVGANDGSSTEGVYLDNQGRVGIGDSTPSQKLDVAGNINLGGDARHIYFGGSNTFIGENSNSTKLQLRGGGNATTSTVFIDTGGAIGVGTSTPSCRIHSVGSGGTQIIKVEATDGNQASFDLMNSEGHYRIITDGGQFRIYDQTDTRQPFTIDTSGHSLFNGNITINDSDLILNNNTFSTYDWKHSQDDAGKLIWTVSGTGGAEMELTSDGSAYGNASLKIGGQEVTRNVKAQTLTNKTLTSPVINTGVSGTAVLDDDTFATASATTIATSESIKAYVDSQSSTITSATNMVDNRILTASGSTTINGEANLTFTGSTLSVVGDISLGDNKNIYIGTVNELQLVHNGNDSIIKHNISTGELKLGSSGTGITFYDPSNGDIYAEFNAGADAILYHNDQPKLATTSTGVAVTGLLSATTKSFVIDHPTKEGMTLRYGSLEGPENGVYVRGRLNGNVIELPEYWVGLVHEDSITVNLTPIGKHQKLYVEDIRDNQIIVGNENLLGKQINCFYTVYAERKDVERFEVEYGNSV